METTAERAADAATGAHPDRTGEFRFAGLGAGRYYIEVSSEASGGAADIRPLWLHRFYKEEAALANATPLDLLPGQIETIAVVVEPAQGYRVRGQIAEAPADLQVSLSLICNDVPLVHGSWDYPTRTFTLARVPPGTYVLEATWRLDGKAFRASLPITVSDSDLDGIVLAQSGK